MKIELKPCPFCGSEATLVEEGEVCITYKVFCSNPACDAQYGWCTSGKRAVNGWNRRVGENHK